DGLERVFIRKLHYRGRGRPPLSTFGAPRRILWPAHIRQRPLPLDEAFHFGLQTQAPAILTNATGIRAQLAPADHNRPSQFHFLDGGVPDVALADRHTGRFAIACWPASPSSSFDTLRHEGL